MSFGQLFRYIFEQPSPSRHSLLFTIFDTKYVFIVLRHRQLIPDGVFYYYVRLLGYIVDRTV